jgi:hypothetical protein
MGAVEHAAADSIRERFDTFSPLDAVRVQQRDQARILGAQVRGIAFGSSRIPP